MIQANGPLLRPPVAKRLSCGIEHLVMRWAKTRCRSLAVGGIKRGFDAPPSVFHLIRFIFRFIELKKITLAHSSSTRQSWVLVFGSQAMPTTRGRTATPSPSRPSAKSAA